MGFPSTRRADRRGLALVLVAGLMGILVMMAFVLLGMARAAWQGAASVRRSTYAGLAAVSGAEYASARLGEGVWPRGTPRADGRGDDWTFREGAGKPLDGALNPSFAHGEPWRDTSTVADGVDNDGAGGIDEPGEVDRILVGGEAPACDLDGDGKATQWSARLRGEGFGAVFCSLRIGSLEGRIPLNAGSLPLFDGVDNNANGSVDEPAEENLDGMYGAANGFPDHCDPEIPAHAGLALALDNLGVIRGVARRRWDVPAGRDTNGDGRGDFPFKAFWIGEDLIRSRPAAGYKDWAEVERMLLSVGDSGGPYTQADADAIRPYIDLEPSVAMGETWRGNPDQGLSSPRLSPICLWSASPEVIEAVWTYLMSQAPCSARPTTGNIAISRHSNDVVGTVPALGTLRCPSSGCTYGYDVGVFWHEKEPVSQVLWPEEAQRLAGRVLSLRGAGRLAWLHLRSDLMAEAERIFEDDWSALAGASSAFRRSWVNAKADMAFHAVAMDPYLSRGAYDVSAAWATGGIDGNPDRDGIQTPQVAGLEWMCRIPYPPVFDPASPPAWPTLGAGINPMGVYKFSSAGSMPNVPFRVKPMGFSLAPPVRFEVESLGTFRRRGEAAARAGVSTRIRAAERLELASQEDFDNRAGAPLLARQGIRVLEIEDASPALSRAARFGCPLPTPAYPLVVSLPHASDSGVSARTAGALGLAPVAAGSLGAGIYWSSNPDYDGVANTAPAGGPAWGEHWPVASPAFAAALTAAPYPPFDRCTPYFATAGTGNGKPSVAYGTSPYKISSKVAPPSSQPWSVFGPFTNQGPDVATVRFPWGRTDDGIGAAPPLQEGAIEAWVTPESMIWLFGSPFGNTTMLKIISLRDWRGSDRSGVLYRLHIEGRNPATGVAIPPAAPEWFVPDLAGSETRTVWSHHVMLHFWRDPVASVTHFRLFVDGSDLSDGGVQMTFDYPLLMSITRFGYKLLSVDEVRSYGPGAGVDPVANRDLGRFIRLGTFRSPLYEMDGAFRLMEAQWTGWKPAHLKHRLTNDFLNPFQVSVEGFAGPGATGGLGIQRLAADSASVAPLSSAFSRSLRSFRYVVTLDCSEAKGFMDDTPVFESIWLTFRRLDGPRWSGWTLR